MSLIIINSYRRELLCGKQDIFRNTRTKIPQKGYCDLIDGRYFYKKAMKNTLIFRLLICIAVLSGCAQPPNKAIELTDADSNKTIEVTTGEEIMLRLTANQSTGYNWVYLDTTQDMIKLVNDNYETDPKFKNANGAGGKHTFHFKAMKPGTSEIHMLYSRSWEKDAWVQRYKVTVRVK